MSNKILGQFIAYLRKQPLNRYAAIENCRRLFKLIKRVYEPDITDSHSDQQIYLTIIFNEILKLTENCLTILNGSANVIGLPILIRSLFERCIDIFLICEDKKIMMNIDLYAMKEEIKILTDLQAEKKRNPSFLTGIVDIEIKLLTLKERIIRLEKEKIQPLDFYNKVEMLDKSTSGNFKRIYIYYRKLSGLSHSNIKEMIVKYKKTDKSGNSIFIFEHSNYEYLMYINFIAQILIYSFNELTKVLQRSNLVTEEMKTVAKNIKTISVEFENV